MDSRDKDLIALLRQNARESLSNLAAALGVSRATVRTRLERLQETGVIAGFTLRLRDDEFDHPVRGITLIKIAGHRTQRIVAQMQKITAIQMIHSTNGKWDLIAEMAAESLPAFDAALTEMRGIDGISESETNLLLATQRHRAAR